MRCLYCKDSKVQKNGVLPRGGQRYNCITCHKHFTVGGESRGTYPTNFKDQLVKKYCHERVPARDLSKEYKISTSTLVSWAKDHRQGCSKCEK